MDRESRKNWFGVVFGLIFFVCGLAAAYGSAGKMIVGYIASSDWVEVPATIQNVKLVSKHGDTTTYSVKSRYSYYFDGVRYQNDRVSLSSGSDNIGRYWQNLERSLRASQRSNEASVIVNPKDPTESLLDRTLRWQAIAFGSMFFILFCGAGGFLIWTALRGTKSREDRLRYEQNEGINSDQKNGSWIVAAFGGVFFVMGVGMSLMVLPDAIREEEYAALFILLFVFVGAGILYHAFKLNQAYRRFGPTPLFLDPSLPGVGGQLGGRFSINVPNIGHKIGSSTQLRARLICTRKSKSGKSTNYSVKWQEEAPVYIKQTATGVNASFLFEIPISCTPSEEWKRGSSIEWNVTVEGEFSASGLGKFERNWGVIVEKNPAQASNVLSIPQNFIEREKEKTEDRTKTSALDQVPVTEDDQYINVHSRAGRGLGGKILGILFGVVFAGIGIFTITQNWWPGYIFVAIGGTIVFISLYVLGKSIEVKIDKNLRILYTQESWFGFVYTSHQGDVLNSDQFRIKQTSSTSTNKKTTEYYAVNFLSNDKTIRIADGIEGKKEALALIDAIAHRCFDQEYLAAAA